MIEAHGSMQAFLDQHIPTKEGDIVDLEGQVLGKHQGVHHYTIGQRKGLGIAAAKPLYVLELDAKNNKVIVGDRDSIQAPDTTVSRVNWVSIAQPEAPIKAAVQLRYRSKPVSVTVVPIEDSNLGKRVKLVFDDPQVGITPGQAAVWYDGDIVLGGGILD